MEVQMNTNKHLVGLFDDEQVLLKAVKSIRGGGVEVGEVYSPFPIHGLEKALDLKPSRLPVVAFIAGCIGLSCALTMQIFMLAIDWPMDVGGKPSLSLPSFVPVSFELTVLFASFGMVLAFFGRSGLMPVLETKVVDPRLTDDLFAMTFDMDGLDAEKVKSMLNENGAIEVREQEL